MAMRSSTPSHQALIRYAFSVGGMIFFFAGSAAVLLGPRIYGYWQNNFNGLTYFELLLYPLMVIACLNGIFGAVRLVKWGKTVQEMPLSVHLPFVSRQEIAVPPSVPLRVMMFIRDNSDLSDLTGSISIQSFEDDNVLAVKQLAGKHGTNAKVALLRVSSEKNNGRIIVNLNIEWRHMARFPVTDSTKPPLTFDIIIKAKISKSPSSYPI